MSYIPGVDYKPTPDEARYLAEQSNRLAAYHWHAIVKGEAWAQEWLDAQPPITLDRMRESGDR